MPAEIKIALDARNLRKFRTLLRASRLEAAKSLTFTAEKAQGAWRLENHRVFHMRRTWIDKGVRKIAATPSTLEAAVYTIDEYMDRHTVGIETEKGHVDPRGLFVPAKPIAEQGTHTQIRRQLAGMARTKTKPFWHNGFLLRRLGKGHRAPLTLLGMFREHIKIKPRLDAEGVVARTVEKEFPTVYERLLLRWAEKN